MPNAMNPVAVSNPAVAASDVMATPSMSPAPTVSEMLPPCVSAPNAARIPMRNAARIVDTALAPMAGANGGELLFAPSVHAGPRLTTVATPTSTQKTASTMDTHFLRGPNKRSRRDGPVLGAPGSRMSGAKRPLHGCRERSARPASTGVTDERPFRRPSAPTQPPRTGGSRTRVAEAVDDQVLDPSTQAL